MTNRGVMKEIRIEIKSELAMNVVHYFMSEENYVYVGNERDIWLENLSHPTVQLINLKVIQVNQVNDLKENEELKYLFPRLVSAQLDQPMAQVMEQMHDSTKEKALNLKQMLMFQTRSTWRNFVFAISAPS